jgi:TrmH family RNA methyltransferase
VTEPIRSTSNERIKQLVRLRKRRERDRTGRFIVEGYREVRRAVETGADIDELFVCLELYLGTDEPRIVEVARGNGAEIVDVAEDPFRKASYRDRPEGLLAVMRQFDVSLDGFDPGPEPLLLVAESIEKPGNLGTMLRTAEAAGATGVIVADPTTDPFNPNVVRASLGTLFLVPLAVAGTPDTLAWLRNHGIQSIATTPDSPTGHYEADLTGPIAIVIGSEQYGLSATWIEGADRRVAIPMPGTVDSLNAAMAAGVLLFEAIRQRRS